MIGVAFEYHDGQKWLKEKKKSDANDPDPELDNRLRYKFVDPNFIDIFHYGFTHAGLLTGKSH